MSKPGKVIKDSSKAYDEVKVIVDAAQGGLLNPWGYKIGELLNSYGIVIDRKTGIKVEITISYPTSTENESIGVGIRYMKPDQTHAEDFFLFEKNRNLTAYYRGAQEDAFPEYKQTHHGQPSKPLHEFLPSIQADLEDLKRKLKSSNPLDNIDMDVIVYESTHRQILEEISQNYAQTSRSLATQTGAPIEIISSKIQPEFTRRRREQMVKWSKSENIYAVKRSEITEMYSDADTQQRELGKLDQLFGK